MWEEKNGAFEERGKGQWFHAIVKCGLEQRCGMRMVMTYCEHTGYGAVFGVLLRVERCKNRREISVAYRASGANRGFPPQVLRGDLG